MNAVANQRRSDESSMKQRSFVDECAREFSHHKQQIADVHAMEV